MQNVIIIFYLIVVVALVIVVLLQRSEGGLGLGGGSSSGVGGLMTGRGQANALTRATAILGGMFFVLSLVLAVMASSNRQPKSVFDAAPAGATSKPVDTNSPAKPSQDQPGILDELRRMQNEAPVQPQVPTSR
jgi:preprotein translocase subunit SecG